MKKTKKSTSGTSFHDVTFKASINQLIGIFGEPTIQDNTGEYKCNFDWHLQTFSGDVFTVYDWKEYRKLEMDEIIEWHIGAFSQLVSLNAKEEVISAL
jgi:hypothetical protein